MEFTQVITSRRSIRQYKADPVPDAKLQKLYQALQVAPTGNNRQPFKFLFVEDDGKRKQMAVQACHQEFLKQPPILMVACCEKGYSFDAAIAVDHMILAATEEGLGTCWIGWFERDAVRRLLDIPEHWEIPIMVSIGFADHEPPARARKSIDELIEVI